MNNIDKITILVNTCDKYSDIWPIFFEVLEKQFDGIDKYKIVLNTEYLDFKYKNFNIKCTRLCKKFGSDITWSKRFYEALKSIKTEYVLHFLEDSFLQEKVDTDYFKKTIDIIDFDRDILALYLNTNIRHGFAPYIEDNKYERFGLLPRIYAFKMSTGIVLWRKDKLMSYIRLNESPWEFEVYGSFRLYIKNEKIYTIKPNSKPVFIEDSFTLGLTKGKWKNENATKEYFDKLGIKVNFAKRGFTGWYYSVKDNIFKDFFKAIWWREMFNKVANLKMIFSVRFMEFISYVYLKIYKNKLIIPKKTNYLDLNEN